MSEPVHGNAVLPPKGARPPFGATPRTFTGGSPHPLGTTGHGLGAGDYSSPAPMLLNGAVKVNAVQLGTEPNFVTESGPGLATRRGLRLRSAPLPGLVTAE